MYGGYSKGGTIHHLKSEAQKYADDTNRHYPKANARVVRDSERVRKMIP